jgi:hypothetical protein
MKKFVFGIVGLLLVSQFIRPHLSNPVVDDKIALHSDEKVMGILKNSCYDCHSNETKYPFTSQIAPTSWLIAEHVNEGREALNFSTWGSIPDPIKIKRLERAKQLINNGLMPLRSYTVIHKNAKLDERQKEQLERFFDEQLQQLKKAS